MINSYNLSTQSLAVNDILTFSNDQIKTGYTVSHAAGTGSFTLRKPGFYHIEFNADVTASTASTVILALYANGDAYNGAWGSVSIPAASSEANIAFSTIIQVRPSCPAVSNATEITIVNTGAASAVDNANIVITKLA